MKGVGYITAEDFADKYGIDAAIVEEDLRAGDREGFRRQGVWFVAEEPSTTAQEPMAPQAVAAPRAVAAPQAAPVRAPAIPHPYRPLRLSSRYSTTRAMSKLIALTGWVAALAGIAGVGLALLKGGAITLDEATVVALLPWLGALLGGPLLVMGGQLIRATVDNADQTRHIVMLLEQQRS